MQVINRSLFILTVLFCLPVILLPVSLCCGAGNTTVPSTDIGLTAGEIDWLKAHPVIRLAPDPDFPPFEFFDHDGKYKGIAADFIALIEKKLPLSFEIVRLKTWDQVLEQGKSREIDMFGAAVPTPERLQYMKFTKFFVEFPSVILVRQGEQPALKVDTLEGKHVAVVSGYAAYEYMKRTHPQVHLEVMPGISAGLRQVAFGKVDAMVLNLASASYFIRKDGISNLKIFKDTGFVYDLSFATRSDQPELNSILDKALATISDEERNRIVSRWISLKSDGWHTSRNFFIALAAVSLLLLLLFIIGWIWLLRKKVAERTIALERELQERILAEKEKKELQQEVHRAKKMEALGLLAGGVAHDLNNILTGIVGYPDLILPGLDPQSRMYKQVEAMQRSGKQAVAVVADLLTITRGTASVKEPIDINQAVMDYLHSPEYRKLIEHFPDIEVRRNLGTGLPCLLGSEIHIRKTIMNLVINGLEAMKDCPGVLTIATKACEVGNDCLEDEDVASGKYVVMSIADTGYGIAEQDLERIFEPFFSRKKMARSGTGLGLAVVWNTVRDHDGFIRVTSDDSGTTFTLNFPAVSETVAQVRDLPTVAELQGRGEKILIVDDEEQVRALALDMLAQLGYTPVEVSSGEDAVRYLRDKQVDLVLLDMIMDPGMDGLDTYKEIIKRNPEQRAVIASGYAENSMVREALSLGVGEYIRKPYSIETLGQVLRRVLSPV
jgi:signal transduction histidine kinase